MTQAGNIFSPMCGLSSDCLRSKKLLELFRYACTAYFRSSLRSNTATKTLEGLPSLIWIQCRGCCRAHRDGILEGHCRDAIRRLGSCTPVATRQVPFSISLPVKVTSKRNSCQETRWKVCVDKQVFVSFNSYRRNKRHFTRESQHKFLSLNHMCHLCW